MMSFYSYFEIILAAELKFDYGSAIGEATKPVDRLLLQFRCEKIMVWIRVLAMEMGEEASSRMCSEDN